MKNSLLFTTLIIGVALAGCNRSTRTETADADRDYTSATATTDQMAADARNAANDAADNTRDAANDVASDIRNAGDRASDELRQGVDAASSAVSNAAGEVVSAARMTEWRLNTSDIQADLEANREIVRTKDQAGAPTGSMDKSTLQAAVEGRIKADSNLSGFNIDVDPGDNGEINLDGEVQNAEQVGKAIALALDTDGVMKVTSKIEVDADAKPRQ